VVEPARLWRREGVTVTVTVVVVGEVLLATVVGTDESAGVATVVVGVPAAAAALVVGRPVAPPAVVAVSAATGAVPSPSAAHQASVDVQPSRSARAIAMCAPGQVHTRCRNR
jgi:hypothetical protein